jgi:sugar-specific transcriptional regulator TrmB
MEKDFTKELEIFGLTVNQAKIYLTIIQAVSISVSKIAESTGLHRQDIYKILPKLEKMGLITKTLGAPTIVKAIPVKKALRNLVSLEKKEFSSRIAQMETSLKELSNTLGTLHETEPPLEEGEPSFTLLTKENEIMNAADILYEKATVECDVVASRDLLTIRAASFRKRFQTAINNGAKIRLILEVPSKDERISTIIQRVRPNSGNFTAKFLINKNPKPFHVVDRKIVWISTAKTQPSGLPCILWSNGQNIVGAYHERFERVWNDSNAITVLPKIAIKQAFR